MKRDKKHPPHRHENRRHILDEMSVLTGKRILIHPNWVHIDFSEPHKRDKRAVTVIFTALAVFGFVMLFPALRLYGDISRSRSWPSTNGTVVNAVYQGPEDEDSEGHEEGVKPKRFLNYVYEVEGKRLAGYRVTLHDDQDRYFAAWVWRRFPRGSSCRVYYDPYDPSQAVLMPGFPWTLERRTWLGVPCFIVGILGLIFRRAIFYKAGWES